MPDRHRPTRAHEARQARQAREDPRRRVVGDDPDARQHGHLGPGDDPHARRQSRQSQLRRARLIRRRRTTLAVAGTFGVGLALLIAFLPGASGRRVPDRATTKTHRPSSNGHAQAQLSSLPFTSRSGAGVAPGPNLAPGSDPSVLPGDVLIADEDNNRLLVVDPAGNVVWQFPGPSALPAGTTFLSPDDAFFTPKADGIIATEETDQVVSLINLPSGHLAWRYGTPGVPGAGANQLSNPDDAMVLPNNDVLVADIKNCSILVTKVGLHTPLERIGLNDPSCLHDPPLRFGSPNGAFPLTDGNELVTEINGDWVDEMTLSGRVLWSTHPPGVAYPSDTNEVSPGVYLTVDYSTPGQIVEFNAKGKLLWRYGPSSGPGMLRTPSLCEPIPTNGDVLCNDDGNDRVIVIDPRTNRIVWQYGHDHVPGHGPGYLSGPDGVDLAPPYSMLVRHAPTMGVPTLQCSSGLPAGACTTFAAGP